MSVPPDLQLLLIEAGLPGLPSPEGGVPTMPEPRQAAEELCRVHRNEMGLLSGEAKELLSASSSPRFVESSEVPQRVRIWLEAWSADRQEYENADPLMAVRLGKQAQELEAWMGGRGKRLDGSSR